MDEPKIDTTDVEASMDALFKRDILPTIEKYATTKYNQLGDGFSSVICKSTIGEALAGESKYFCRYHTVEHWYPFVKKMTAIENVPTPTLDCLNVVLLFADAYAFYDMKVNPTFIDQDYIAAASIVFDV